LQDGIDWKTTVIGALSFLLHFGALGSLYSDWMDPVVDDDLHASALIQAVRELPRPAVLDWSGAARRRPPKRLQRRRRRRRPAGTSGSPGPTRGPGSTHPARERREAHQISELDAWNVEMTACSAATAVRPIAC
jgi:hypothetical protein